MNIPVEAATTLFGPQPIRIKDPREWTEYDEHNEHNEQETKTVRRDSWYASSLALRQVFQRATVGLRENVEEFIRTHSDNSNDDRPRRPSLITVEPPSPPQSDDSDDSNDTVEPTEISPEGIGYRSRQSIKELIEESNHVGNRRRSSIELGNRVQVLLQHEEIKKAVTVLQDAIKNMNMHNKEEGEETSDEDQEETAPRDEKEVSSIYSRIIEKICSPGMTKMTNEITDVDLSTPEGVYESVPWRLFAKVISAGYELEDNAYMSLIRMLTDNDCGIAALQVVYAFPSQRWTTEVYRLAIELHLLQSPKQVKEAEALLYEYGSWPKDNDTSSLIVTVSDRLDLWFHFENVLGKLVLPKSDTKRRSSSIKEWVFQHLHIQLAAKNDSQRMEKYEGNVEMFSAMAKGDNDHAWFLFTAMGDNIDEITPRIVMHVCWLGYHSVSGQEKHLWESRAWSLYARFMCSEYLHPEQNKTSGFLSDLLSITASSVEMFRHERYTKIMGVYQLLTRLQLEQLLRDEQVITPVLMALYMACAHSSPTIIVSACYKGMNIWRAKQQLDEATGQPQPTTFSMYWVLLALCLKAGDVEGFAELLRYLSEVQECPDFIATPIQQFHDQYLCHHQDEDDKETSCYFDRYLFRPVLYTEMVRSSEDRGMRRDDSPEHQADKPLVTEVADIINDTRATRALFAASITENDLQLIQPPGYTSVNKSRALFRHCLSITKSQTCNFC